MGIDGDVSFLSKRSSAINRPTDPDGLVLEAWAQGFMVGTLLFMIAVTIANMRARVLLHKLILAELILGLGHGTFIYFHEPVYGWYLSATAVGLNISWSLHNVISWLKNKPFMGRAVSLFYISTVILAQPYWVIEIYANFAYFNNMNKIFERTRPFETLFRDPWWIYTTCNLFWVIKSQYEFGIIEIVRVSPRFGVMLTSMCLSVGFLIIDLLSVLHVFSDVLPTGLNPFWKLSYVLKCLCDMVILDDFKTALDHLRNHWLMKNGPSDRIIRNITQPQRPYTQGSPFERSVEPIVITTPLPTKGSHEKLPSRSSRECSQFIEDRDSLPGRSSYHDNDPSMV